MSFRTGAFQRLAGFGAAGYQRSASQAPAQVQGADVLRQVYRVIARKRWDANLGFKTKNWFESPPLLAHYDRRISPETGRGVLGEMSRIPSLPLRLGLSIGAGLGKVEREILKEGLVERFELFELSPKTAARARQQAAEDGLSDRVTVRTDDFYKRASRGDCDLVLWHGSLHHMFDVDSALSWSAETLRSGGWLVMNEYVGPPRLQWPRREVDFARTFLRRNAACIGYEADQLKYKGELKRLRQYLRDPSEAPQSDKIVEAYIRRCGGPITKLGGAMLHLCAPFVTHLEHDHPMYDELAEWDLASFREGMCHFAFAKWRKP